MKKNSHILRDYVKKQSCFYEVFSAKNIKHSLVKIIGFLLRSKSKILEKYYNFPYLCPRR